jgi:hypothetical protein
MISLLSDKELFIRWLEITTFMPSIQYSISPWQYEDEEVSAISKYWTDFHREIIAPIYIDIFERYIAGEDVLPIGKGRQFRIFDRQSRQNFMTNCFHNPK